MLHNGLRHSGAILPFSFNVLLQNSLRHRWDNSNWNIVAISKIFASMPCFTMVLDTLERSPNLSWMHSFNLVLGIGELTHLLPLAQYPKFPSMTCFTMVLDTLERSSSFPSMRCFNLVLDISELTSIETLVQYTKFPPQCLASQSS